MANEAANGPCPCPCPCLPESRTKAERINNGASKVGNKTFYNKAEARHMPRCFMTSLTNFTSFSPPQFAYQNKGAAGWVYVAWKRSFPCALCKLIKQSQGDNRPAFPPLGVRILHAVTPAGYLHAAPTVPIQIVWCDFYRFLWLRVEFQSKRGLQNEFEYPIVVVAFVVVATLILHLFYVLAAEFYWLASNASIYIQVN